MGFGSSAQADARLISLALHPTCSCISADIDGQAVTMLQAIEQLTEGIERGVFGPQFALRNFVRPDADRSRIKRCS